MAVAGQRRPFFFWVPSRKSNKKHGQMRIPKSFFLGNGWADWFGRAGVLEHRVSKVYEEFYKVELSKHQCVAKCMARAMHRMRTLGGWNPERPHVPARALSFPRPQVTAVERQLVRLATGLMLCRSCCRTAAMESGPTLV
eukprot:9426463-Pyramimonas_sp.AAC.1